jgi:hypothetical protein
MFSTATAPVECGALQVIPVLEAVDLAEDIDDKAVWSYLVPLQLGQA